MSAKIDPLGVARAMNAKAAQIRLLQSGVGFVDVTGEESEALAKVVIAAATVIDTLPSSYDPHDDLVVRHAQALNALVEALKGEK